MELQLTAAAGVIRRPLLRNEPKPHPRQQAAEPALAATILGIVLDSAGQPFRSAPTLVWRKALRMKWCVFDFHAVVWSSVHIVLPVLPTLLLLLSPSIAVDFLRYIFTRVLQSDLTHYGGTLDYTPGSMMSNLQQEDSTVLRWGAAYLSTE